MATPINVASYAVDRRKALAQRIAGMMGSGGRAPGQAGRLNAQSHGGNAFGNMFGNPQPGITQPYLQSPGTTAGLGVVNAGDPTNPFDASQAPGQGVQTPGQMGPTGPASINAGPNGPAALGGAMPTNPILGGQGTYGGGGSGIYGVPGAIPPELIPWLRPPDPNAPPPELAPYGGATRGGNVMRF